MKKTINILLVLSMIFFSTVSFAEEQTNRLTHGMVKKFIVKGETTQAEILQLFGGPNITTLSKKGDEVWTYEKISYTETTHGGSSARAAVLGGAAGAGIGAIIGHQSKETGAGAAVGGALGALAGMLGSYKRPVHEQTSRSVTFMIWFNDDDTVKDYSIISTNY